MDEDHELDQALLEGAEESSASSREAARSDISDELERATGQLVRENEKLRSHRSIADQGSVNDIDFRPRSRYSSFDSKRSSADQQVRIEDSPGQPRGPSGQPAETRRTRRRPGSRRGSWT